MPPGTRLYYKAREQTSEEVPDAATTEQPETAGKTPNEERSKRSETCTQAQHPVVRDKPQCCVCSAGCTRATDGVRAAGQRLQTMAPHACNNCAIRSASAQVRTDGLISKGTTEMQRVCKAQHPPRDPGESSVQCWHQLPRQTCCGEQHKVDNITLSHFLLERSTRGRHSEDPGKSTT